MNKFGISPALAIGEMHPLFKPLLWVSTAISDDETRSTITNIHVEKDELVYHIVATAGRRLHVSTFDPGMLDSDFEGFEIGDYEVITRSAKSLVIARHHESIHAATTSIICMRTGKLLATDFLIDAIGFGHGYKKTKSVSVRFGADPAGGFGVLIAHELGKALVMRMRSDDDDDDDATAPPKTEAEATTEMESITKHFAPENAPE